MAASSRSEVSSDVPAKALGSTGRSRLDDGYAAHTKSFQMNVRVCFPKPLCCSCGAAHRPPIQACSSCFGCLDAWMLGAAVPWLLWGGRWQRWFVRPSHNNVAWSEGGFDAPVAMVQLLLRLVVVMKPTSQQLRHLQQLASDMQRPTKSLRQSCHKTTTPLGSSSQRGLQSLRISQL